MLWMWLMEKLDFDLPVFIPAHHPLSPPTFLSKRGIVINVVIRNLLL